MSYPENGYRSLCMHTPSSQVLVVRQSESSEQDSRRSSENADMVSMVNTRSKFFIMENRPVIKMEVEIDGFSSDGGPESPF